MPARGAYRAASSAVCWGWRAAWIASCSGRGFGCRAIRAALGELLHRHERQTPQALGRPPPHGEQQSDIDSSLPRSFRVDAIYLIGRSSTRPDFANGILTGHYCCRLSGNQTDRCGKSG
jgi:hypothetical protein